MNNKKIEKENNWTNRDWFWLLGILISIIILLIASIFAKNLKIETNFSIISSAVSIALALVAIFIALNQSRDNQELSTSLSVMMSIMNEKINNVDEKVGKIDPDVFVKVYRQKFDDMLEEVGQTIKKSGEITPDEIEAKYREKLNLLESEIDHIINSQIKEENDFPLYFVGEKVVHKKWGLGEVNSVKGTGSNTEIEVNFSESVGKKHLLAKFAPIKKVK